MDSIGLALRLWIIIYGVTFFCLKLFTYLFHGQVWDENIYDLSLSITGLMASTVACHLFFKILRTEKNFKNYFIFYFSFFGIIFNIYFIVIRVI